ncbi:MAG: hypothetical protein ACOYA8_03805 [Clostridium sp.]|jgi:hypothetical protein
MANFNIKENPLFKKTMRKLETTDRAHASVFNALFEILLDNDNALFKRFGRTLFGPADTPMEPNDILFIIEEEPQEISFEGAAFDNLTFSRVPPASGENWAAIGQEGEVRAGKETGIINGKLAVSEEAPSDAAFFADLSNESEEMKDGK